VLQKVGVSGVLGGVSVGPGGGGGLHFQALTQTQTPLPFEARPRANNPPLPFPLAPSVEPIIMSAGELEHEWAGMPGKLIRERYRKAAELSRVRGKLSCLLINDIDAGLSHFENTQVHVVLSGGFAFLMPECSLMLPCQLCSAGFNNDQPVSKFQVTVNNQIVVASLMNICDAPNKVTTGWEWREGDSIWRIPIIVTGE
jgi:hypothetical protein